MIDSHVHMKEWNEKAWNYVAKSAMKQFWVMDDMPRKNVKQASQKELIQASKDFPGKIIPFALINWKEDVKQVDRLFEKGFVGLKAIWPPKPYDDLIFFPIYERANQLSMPILFHTGIISTQRYGSLPEGCQYGPTNMEPAALAGIAAAFPKLIIIGGHLGYPYLEQTHHNLYYYPNIYHDVCGYVPWEWLIENLGSSCCYHKKGANYFYQKILFATDCLLGDEESHERREKSQKFWPLFFDIVGRYYPWGEGKENVLFKNAQKIIQEVLKKHRR